MNKKMRIFFTTLVTAGVITSGTPAANAAPATPNDIVQFHADNVLQQVEQAQKDLTNFVENVVPVESQSAPINQAINNAADGAKWHISNAYEQIQTHIDNVDKVNTGVQQEVQQEVGKLVEQHNVPQQVQNELQRYGLTSSAQQAKPLPAQTYSYKSATPKPAKKAATKATGKQGIVNTARSQVGTPYVYGGTSPAGFDCSGYVQWVYAKNGVQLPRTSQAQASVGTSVPLNQLQPGDLVFYYGTGHVSIYVGNGKVAHSPTSGQSVSVVDMYSMPISFAKRV